jgi:uncharacterized protein
VAKSPLVLDITPLKRQPGRQFPFRLSLPAPASIRLITAEVEARELHLDLLVESVGLQLVATGSIRVDWVGPCRRCLEDQHGTTDLFVKEVFEKVPVEGETYALAEDEVDLEPMVRESVLLGLPVAPLCSPTCPGPDPERFPTSVIVDPPEPEAVQAPPVDPRWAALGELSFEE